MAEPTWIWDPSVCRYRDLATGRFLSHQTVLALVDRFIAVHADQAGALVGLLVEKRLTVADWELAMRSVIKTNYIQQYVLAKGGLSNMTQADWGRIGGYLKDQYRYLHRFAQEIAAGRLSPGQIEMRARMYMHAAREAFEKVMQMNARDVGMEEEVWVLGEAEHCQDCVGFAAQGWQPIGTFPIPGAGATQCLTNCQCHKEYRKRLADGSYLEWLRREGVLRGQVMA